MKWIDLKEFIFGPFRPLAKNWFILIFAPPGNGKSIEQARISYYLLREYFYTEKHYPQLPKRFLFTNQTLRRGFDAIIDRGFDTGHILEWDEPDQFRFCPRKECWKGLQQHRLHDCDLMVDEGSTLFPADGYANTPMWLRKLWAQHRHNGIRIVMLTQDYEAIDINCRRMLWKTFFVQKRIGSRDITPTLPPLYRWTIFNFLNPKRDVIWGVYTSQEMSPTLIKNKPETLLQLQLNPEGDQAKKMEEVELIGWPKPHVISWWKCNLYDTTQDVKEYQLRREYEHLVGVCKEPDCDYEHVTHRLK